MVQDFRNEDSTMLQKRIALWAIGNIGKTRKGIVLLQQENIIKNLIWFTENSEFLSLRGTCYYILNFICSRSLGRKELQSLNWKTYLINKGIYVCLPHKME